MGGVYNSLIGYVILSYMVGGVMETLYITLGVSLKRAGDYDEAGKSKSILDILSLQIVHL